MLRAGALPLQSCSQHTKHIRVQPDGTDKCLMCDEEAETTQHFIMRCASLSEVREKYKSRLEGSSEQQVMMLQQKDDPQMVQELWNTRKAILVSRGMKVPQILRT